MSRIHPKTIEILVANASEAKIYITLKLGQEMQFIKEYKHPESREKGDQLVSDRPGHYEARSKGAHGAFVEHSSPKQVEAERFAREIASALNNARNGNQFDKLIIIAPPHFYGLLAKHCTHQVRGLTQCSIKKDFTKMPERELKAYLKELHA